MMLTESGGRSTAIGIPGHSWFPSDRRQAGGLVGALVARGYASIDVGCLQVNLRWHPLAFHTLDEAFDPTRNADYAARYLRSLAETYGDWWIAVQRYNTARPDIGRAYAALVARRLTEIRRRDAGRAVPAAERRSGGPLFLQHDYR